MYKRSKPLHYHVVCSHKLLLLFNYSIKIANRVRNFVFSDKSSTQSIFYYTRTGFSHGFKPSPWIKFRHVIKKLENNNILRNVPLFPNQFLLLTMLRQRPCLLQDIDRQKLSFVGHVIRNKGLGCNLITGIVFRKLKTWKTQNETCRQ